MNDRTAHMDLLSQVEHDQATRDTVRRILSEPLTEHELELDARIADRESAVSAAIATRRSCHGPCDQGRKCCPTRDACVLPAEAGAGVTLRDFWDSCTPGAKIGWAIVGAITIASLVWHVVARMA